MASRNWHHIKYLTLCCCLVVFVITFLVGWHLTRVVHAATVPIGFTDSLVVNGLINPTGDGVCT